MTDQAHALAALDEALTEELVDRFRIVLVSELSQPTGIVGRLKGAVMASPPGLDVAVARFETGIVDMLAAYARCRDVVIKLFPPNN